MTEPENATGENVKPIGESLPGFLIAAEPSSTIPKMATHVNLFLMKNGDVVMRFVNRLSDDQPGALIESILVDHEHAKKIVDTLSNLLKKIEEEKK